jgi:hypothetical protein
MGDLPRYRELVMENLEHARRLGDRRIEARSVGSLAMWELEDGHLDRAMEHLRESNRIDQELANPMFLGVDLVRFAWILALHGDAARAAQLIGRSERVWTDIGTSRESWMEKEYQQVLDLVRARMKGADLEAGLAEGRRLSLDEAFELAVARASPPAALPAGDRT